MLNNQGLPVKQNLGLDPFGSQGANKSKFMGVYAKIDPGTEPEEPEAVCSSQRSFCHSLFWQVSSLFEEKSQEVGTVTFIFNSHKDVFNSHDLG